MRGQGQLLAPVIWIPKIGFALYMVLILAREQSLTAAGGIEKNLAKNKRRLPSSLFHLLFPAFSTSLAFSQANRLHSKLLQISVFTFLHFPSL